MSPSVAERVNRSASRFDAKHSESSFVQFAPSDYQKDPNNGSVASSAFGGPSIYSGGLGPSDSFFTQTPPRYKDSMGQEPPASNIGSRSSTPFHSNKGSTVGQDYKQLKLAAEEYHTAGFNARKKGDFAKAVELYTEALLIMP